MAASDLISQTPAHRLEAEVVEWTEAVYSEARYEQGQSPEMKLTGKLIDYIHGRQWSPQARFGRSRPVVNRLFRQFIEMTGLLTDIEPDFKVKFYQGDSKEFTDLEKLLNEMITDWAIMSDFESDLSQTIMYGILHTGYAKVQWNPALRFGAGDNQFIPISPDSILMIGAANKLQEAECLCYAQPVTMAYLKRKHGDVARGVRPDLSIGGIGDEVTRPSKIADWQWKRLNPQLKRMLGQKAEGGAGSYPMVMRKEFWIKDDAIWDGKESRLIGPENAGWSYWVEPGMPIYPRGRIVVTAGRKVLEDGPNPYWHGMFPFAQYRPYRVPWQLEGLSSLAPGAAIQNVLNRIYGGVMDTIVAGIEPTLIAPKAAFSQQAWDSMDPGEPGGKMAYNNNTPKVPEFRKPPELGNYVQTMAAAFEKEQDSMSGSSAMQQALQKKQVPGGDSLDMILGSKSINIRMMGRELKSFLVPVGTFVSCNNLQFSTAKSRAGMFGGAGLTDGDFTPIYGTMKPASMEPEDFVKRCAFSIRKGSLLAIEKAEEVQIAFALRKNHDVSRKRLLKKIGMSDVDIAENDKELLAEAMQVAGVQALAGGGAGKGHGKK
jgi:hypothetical protein